MHLKYSLKEGKNLIGLCPKIPVAYGRVKMVHEAAFFCSGVNWPSLHKDKDHKGVALIGQFMVHGARFPPDSWCGFSSAAKKKLLPRNMINFVIC